MPDTVDVIMVPGAALMADGSPGAPMRRRVSEAARLLREGRGQFMILSGGAVSHPVPEADVMKDLAIRAGVPADTILVDTKACHSWDNVVHSLAIMRAQGFKTCLVVSDRFHLPRLRALFRLHGATATFVAAPLLPGDSRSAVLAATVREVFAMIKFFAMAVRFRSGKQKRET